MSRVMIGGVIVCNTTFIDSVQDKYLKGSEFVIKGDHATGLWVQSVTDEDRECFIDITEFDYFESKHQAFDNALDDLLDK